MTQQAQRALGVAILVAVLLMGAADRGLLLRHSHAPPPQPTVEATPAEQEAPMKIPASAVFLLPFVVNSPTVE